MGHSEYLRTNRDAHDSTPWEPPGPARYQRVLPCGNRRSGLQFLEPFGDLLAQRRARYARGVDAGQPLRGTLRVPAVEKRHHGLGDDVDGRASVLFSEPWVVLKQRQRQRAELAPEAVGLPGTHGGRRRNLLIDGGDPGFEGLALDQDQLPTGQLPMIGYRRRWVSEPALHGCAQRHASADSLASPSAHLHVHASP
jgi:hypothetical protein